MTHTIGLPKTHPFHEAVLEELQAAVIVGSIGSAGDVELLCRLIERTIVPSPAWMVDRLVQIGETSPPGSRARDFLSRTIFNLQHRVSSQTCGNA